jgi:hypothetical protein
VVSHVTTFEQAVRRQVGGRDEGLWPEETQAHSRHSTGAVFCEVRVNTVTGETRVDRLLGMGIGLALMEDTTSDERNGRIMTTRPAAAYATYRSPSTNCSKGRSRPITLRRLRVVDRPALTLPARDAALHDVDDLVGAAALQQARRDGRSLP